MVALAVGRTAVTRDEQSLHLLRRERLRQMRESPEGYLRQACGEIGLNRSALQRIAQEGTQRRQRLVDTAAADALGFTQNETV
jgi:hypothetical protein